MNNFYYVPHEVNSIAANFTTNILSYLSDKNEFSNYKNLFRSIDLNKEKIETYSNETKLELIDLIDQLYEPVNNYYNKYLKGFYDTNQRFLETHNLEINLNESMEYKYHLNKFNNMISNIDYSIDSYLREIERNKDIEVISFNDMN